MKCRHCGTDLKLEMIDLGSAPLSNAYLNEVRLKAPEKWFPLRVMVCDSCWLVQTQDVADAHEMFDAEYAYYSGYSTSWLAHCERFVAAMVTRFGLNRRSHVVEIGANDGSLLQFAMHSGIPCTGVEPTACTARAAREMGIPIVGDFFGTSLAKELVGHNKQADLTFANNVLAHVPDINDFVAGFPILLKPQGVATFEFPHLLRLVFENQFDTIYHEHFSYLSLIAVNRVFACNGLTVFDVEEHSTHGGSLRVFAHRTDTGNFPRSKRVEELLRREEDAGVTKASYYSGFQAVASNVKNDLLGFLIDAKRQEKAVAAYGAAAKGNTLLNFAGIRPDLISYVVDRNPAKQGKYMPGSRIPIVSESRLRRDQPDYVLILPWNIRSEVIKQISYIREWHGKFVTAVPHLEVIP